MLSLLGALATGVGIVDPTDPEPVHPGPRHYLTSTDVAGITYLDALDDSGTTYLNGVTA